MTSNIILHAFNLFRNSTRDIGLTKRSGAWKTVEKHWLEEHPACEICGSETRLNVHHKLPFRSHPELELDLTNLITLCMSSRECHLLIAHGDAFKFYSKTIDADVKILQDDISKFDQVAERAKANRVQ